MEKVVIIGGGIIGQFIAYYLSQSDYEVVIVDDAPEMPPASAGNCGLVTPSHIAPLNSFSAMLQGVKWLGKKDAPLSIKPQLDGAFIKWFLSFMWHSRKSSINRVVAIRNEMLQSSWRLYQEYLNSELSKSAFKPDGLMFVANSKSGFQTLRKEVEFLSNNSLSSEIITKSKLLDIEPSIKEDAVGGAIFHTDGWLRPDRLLEEIKKINSKNGVKTYIGQVTEINTTRNSITSIQTEEDQISSNKFILAAGAPSYLLAKKIGISLPMIPGKGYNLTYSTSLKNQPKLPVYMFEKKVVATPWTDGFRLGSTMEFTGFDNSLNTKRLEALQRASKEYLHTDIDQSDPQPWAGWRPMSSRGLPIIEQSSKYQNLIISTGHGMLGLSLAPATGRIVSELIKKGDSN